MHIYYIDVYVCTHWIRCGEWQAKLAEDPW